jgi:GMP synthase-like glutamine amidotransferase
MMLLIQIHSLQFHYYEFVKPIEDILRANHISFISKHYKHLSEIDITNAKKIIICGTSLKDNTFLNDLSYFQWIPPYKGNILGICGGMHLLGLIYNESLEKKQEIGLHRINLKTSFFGEKEEIEVYELHNYCLKPSTFSILAHSKKCPQIIKHPKKPHYGVLFHPEVRNKQLIASFLKGIEE